MAADAVPVAPAAATADGTATLTAERRRVSVLFVDLVGFTRLSEERDPEAVRELLSDYFDQARTLVRRYGGTIEKFIGVAVMAVWGTPSAREDDAERAVRAALDLVDAVAALGEHVERRGLRARAGVVTGEAAVHLDAVDKGMVAGDVVNTASRVQAAADPGQVLVEDDTRKASAQAIDYAEAGEHVLKGRVEPVRLYAASEIVAGSGGAQRFDGLEPPFLGRERDLRMLIVHEGETADALYVIVEGEVDVSAQGELPAPENLRTLGPGEYFGEIGLLAHGPRTATVRALTDVVLERIPGEDFLAALNETRPTAAFMEVARMRLARTNPSRTLEA